MTETKIKPSSILVLATAAGFASVAMAADPVPAPATAPAKPVTFVDAVTGGKAHLEFRYRLESVDQDPFADDALASTLRSRLNYATGDWHGFSAFVEADNVTVLGDDDTYNSTTNGVTDRPVVADPECTEVNQWYLQFKSGSFTGLRIACAVTQGLALGADLPVVGVSTLESLAEQTGAERVLRQDRPEGERLAAYPLRVLTVLDARMAEVYWAAYQRDGSGWRTVSEPQLALPESVTVPPGADWVGAGNGFVALGEVLRPRLAAQLARIDDTLMPDAAASMQSMAMSTRGTPDRKNE